MIVTVVLWGAALAALPLSRRLTGEYLSPVALIVSAWCGTLGLYTLRLLAYPVMRPSTQLFILAAVVLLVGGTIAGQRLVAGGPERRRTRLPKHPDLWVSAFALLGVAGTFWYVWAVTAHLGESAFDTPHLVRGALGSYEIPSRFLFLQYFCLAGPLLGIALRLGGVKLSWLTWILVVVCALCTWITTDRTQFFLLTLTAFFMYATHRGEALDFRRVVMAVTVCAALLVANFTLVGAWLGKTPRNLGLTMQLPAPAATPVAVEPAPPAPAITAPSTPAPVTPAPAPSPTSAAPVAPPTVKAPLRASLERLLQRGAPIYLYATGSYPALDVLMATPIDRTHGVHVMYPIARLLQRSGLVSVNLPPAIPKFVSLGIAGAEDRQFNGYTFLYYPLVDFGPAGALVYAAVIGLLVGLAYGWTRRNRDAPLRLLVMGQLATALVLSIFVSKFNNTASWYIALLTALPFLVARVRDSPDA